MSKASDFVKAQQGIFHKCEDVSLRVNNGGGLSLKTKQKDFGGAMTGGLIKDVEIEMHINADQIPSLIRWLEDTFLEPSNERYIAAEPNEV